MSGRFLIFVLLAASLVMGGTFYWVLKQSGDFRGMVGEQIRQEFISYATEVRSVSSLQVAELDQMEIFERSSEQKILWDQLALPQIIVRITAPVRFVYTVDMKSPWRFVIDDTVLLVVPPPLAFNPPAVDLSATKFEVKKGSIFRDEGAALRSLQKDLTPLLNERAQKNVGLVKETARKSIEEFVLTWMKTRFADDTKKLVVKVQFQDEAPQEGSNP